MAPGGGWGVTWVPRLEDYLTQSELYKLTGLELSRANSRESFHRRKHTDKLRANMMMLKVEELVRKTHYFYAVKDAGSVLVFI